MRRCGRCTFEKTRHFNGLLSIVFCSQNRATMDFRITKNYANICDRVTKRSGRRRDSSGLRKHLLNIKNTYIKTYDAPLRIWRFSFGAMKIEFARNFSCKTKRIGNISQNKAAKGNRPAAVFAKSNWRLIFNGGPRTEAFVFARTTNVRA